MDYMQDSARLKSATNAIFLFFDNVFAENHLKKWNFGVFLAWLHSKHFLQGVGSCLVPWLEEIDRSHRSSLLMLEMT